MFGRYDAAEFATIEHYANVKGSIEQLKERHDLFNGDIEHEHAWAIYPQVAEFALEYVTMLQGIPNIPHFLINFEPESFTFHWQLKGKIDLRIVLDWDKKEQQRSAWYMEMDMDRVRNGMYVSEDVAPADYDKILDRLNNPQFTYGS